MKEHIKVFTGSNEVQWLYSQDWEYHDYGKQQKNWIKNWQNVCAVFADGGKFRNRNFRI